MPSNFIEKLRGEDLLEFHRCAVFATNAVEEEEFETVVPINLPLDLPVITTPEREIPPICEYPKNYDFCCNQGLPFGDCLFLSALLHRASSATGHAVEQ